MTQPTQTVQSQQERSVVSKVLLKAVTKNKKDHGKYFCLHSSNSSSIKSCADLKSIIRQSFSDEVMYDEFDVGYVQYSIVAPHKI